MRWDAAFIVDTGAKHEALLKIVKKYEPSEREKVELCVIYEGKNLGWKKSRGYAFAYRSEKRSLSDEAVNGWQKKTNEALQNGVPTEIREGKTGTISGCCPMGETC